MNITCIPSRQRTNRLVHNGHKGLAHLVNICCTFLIFVFEYIVFLYFFEDERYVLIITDYVLLCRCLTISRCTFRYGGSSC